MLTRVPGAIGSALGACLGASLTVGLFLIVAIVSVARFLMERLARLRDLATWLLKKVKQGIRRCTIANGALVRRFVAVERIA
jgi:hypothetical protein